MEAWEKKVDRIENNPRRKAKESKTREYYEKQFPEIRKQREQQERFQRYYQGFEIFLQNTSQNFSFRITTKLVQLNGCFMLITLFC